MGFTVPRSDPSFVYVVNDATERASFRARGASVMSDCLGDATCVEDILDPIVRPLL